tara:strand:+ start:660 stop:1619 length:960 start_codon:yes stop_codon:yes gene_type:complete
MSDIKQRADGAYSEIKNKLNSILQKAQANNSTIKKQDDDLGEAKRRIDEIKNRLEALKGRLVELIRVLKEKGSVSEEVLARFDEINRELAQIEGIDFSDNSVSIAALLESISQLEAKVSELEGLADSENSGGNNAGEKKMTLQSAAKTVGQIATMQGNNDNFGLSQAHLAYNDPQDPAFLRLLNDLQSGDQKERDDQSYIAERGRNSNYQLSFDEGNNPYYFRPDGENFFDGNAQGNLVSSSYEHPSTYPTETTGGKKRKRRKRKSKKTRRKRKSKKKGGYKFDAVAIKSRKSRLQTRKLNSRKRKRTKKKRRRRRRRR